MPNISQPKYDNFYFIKFQLFNIYNSVAEFLLTNFSFETIVEIIIESMNYLPPPPPVPVSEDVFQVY